MWELICEKHEHIRDSLVRVKREHVCDLLVCEIRELVSEEWEHVREKTF